MLRLLLTLTLLSSLTRATPPKLSKSEITIQKLKVAKLIKQKNLKQVRDAIEKVFIPQGEDISDILESEKAAVRNMMNQIEKKINRNQPAQKVRPVFKWGQSKRYVYVHIKYSHRFDAPGCLDIFNQTVGLNEDQAGQSAAEERKKRNGRIMSDLDLVKFEGGIGGQDAGRFLDFEAWCEIAGVPSRFVLQFELYEKVRSWRIVKGNALIYIILYVSLYLLLYISLYILIDIDRIKLF